MEDERSVPLEERIVISMGTRELRTMSIRFFLFWTSGSCSISGEIWSVEKALRDMPYLELLAESLFAQVPSVNRIDSKIL